MVTPRDIPPLTVTALRKLSAASAPHSAERRLLWEIWRLHAVLREIDACREIVRAAWAETDQGNLVALTRMRSILLGEPAISERRPRDAE